jgi:hypothetical protein
MAKQIHEPKNPVSSEIELLGGAHQLLPGSAPQRARSSSLPLLN